MKQMSRIASAVALVAGLAGSSQVMAAEICNNCYYRSTDATYLGVHNANTFDSSGFRRDEFSVPTTTFIRDTWIFDLQPVGGAADISASFRPVSIAFTDFKIEIFKVSSYTCPTQSNSDKTSTDGACSAFTLVGPAIATSTALGTSGAAIEFAALAAGSYAFQVSGFAKALDGALSNYSGQIGFSKIPEPTTLALVGLALVGAAVGSRRKQA